MTDPANRPPQDVPFIYASGVTAAASGTDFQLVFTNTHPRPGTNGGVADERTVEWTAVVTMSFHTAKDLYTLLGDIVSNLEDKFGNIDTPYLQGRRNREPS